MYDHRQMLRWNTGMAVSFLLSLALLMMLTGCGSSGGVSPTYTLNVEIRDPDGSVVNAGDVLIEPSKSRYALLDAVTLEAVPDSGWELLEWKDAATNETVDMPILMTANRTIIAVFDIIAGEFAYGAGTAANPFLIGTPDQLHNVRDHLDKHFRVIRDLDMAGFGDPDEGWEPIGTSLQDSFSGKFDGNEHVIRNLTINRAGNTYSGLFGYASGEIANVVLKDATIVGRTVGALVGYGWGVIRYCSVIGDSRIEGEGYVGGLVGWLYGGTVQGCFTTGTVQATNSSGGVGGMVGRSTYPTIKDSVTEVTLKLVGSVSSIGGFVGHQEFGSIQDCQALGSMDMTSVTSTTRVGGFVGNVHQDSLIERCHAAVDVVMNTTASASTFGGFVGSLRDGMIRQSYATGTVTAETEVGGFVGLLGSGTIEDSYAHGHASATDSTPGGFVGQQNAGSIDRCYSVGQVTPAGGFFGSREKPAVVTACYYNKDTGGEPVGQEDFARTTVQLQRGTPGAFLFPSGTVDRFENQSNLMYDQWNGKVWDFSSVTDYPTFHW